jgi:Tol biopolymer transport system component
MLVRRVPAAGLTLAVLAAASLAARAAEPEAPCLEAQLLSRVRQLTFEGRRAGEGYFSADGRRMVFQSERVPGNPFFQIFELDLETGATRQVSPGTGKTTCAFSRPGTSEILFASTHHDPESERLQREEIELRASGNERRYEWDFDAAMDLYVDRDGELRRLTDASGYDAEGSYSPDGQWIVFSSTRQAYGRDLEPEDERRLEVDPSWFAEIYRMRADGSGVERLTDAPGYDGGPFFTADGARIVWRRFEPDGAIADVWIMSRDGSGQKKLTSFDSMSWAPYPHPSGEYLIFTSNKYGFGNFELFLVDLDGTKEPVRVTCTDGFDGLPVPSPDGGKLAWTSNRRGTSQIFLGSWNHELALDAVRRAPARKQGATP